jgi:vacuolar-type H+-ATPase subunit F/Vma7
MTLSQCAAESEIIHYSLTPAVVLIPVDSEGKPMRELVFRSILQELDKANRKKDWSVPYHR